MLEMEIHGNPGFISASSHRAISSYIPPNAQSEKTLRLKIGIRVSGSVNTGNTRRMIEKITTYLP